MNQCSNIKGQLKSFEIECDEDYTNRPLPDKYRWLLNVQGFVDIPEYELLPGNMYATNRTVRFTKTT